MTAASRKLLVAAILLGAVLAVAVLRWRAPSAKQAAGSAPVPVHVVQVARRDISDVVRAMGTVRSQSTVSIRPQVDGELIELLVKEGQQVKRGDLLARIDDRAIVAALDEAKAQLAVSKAQLKSAQLDLERYLALQKDHAVSIQLLDQQKARVEQLEATVGTSKAAVAAKEVQLSFTRIHSPTDGRVGIRNVDVGSLLRAGDTVGLFSVTQLAPVSVEVALPQAMLPQLQAMLGETRGAITPVLAYDSEGGTLLEAGHLALIDNRVTTATATIRVKAEFANAQGKLWPDQSVAVSVQSRLLRDVLVVPLSVVQRGLDGDFVYRVRDGKAEAAPVRMTYSDSSIAVVTGVDEGDTVVVDGQSRLRAGAKVRVVDTVQTQPGET